MKMNMLFSFCMWFVLTNAFSQQSRTLFLLDVKDAAPISDFYVFVDQSSISALSDEDGQVVLSSDLLTSDLVYFSHVNYGLLSLLPSQLKDTLYFEKIIQTTSTVEVRAKRSNKRKKWLNKFNRAFLGTERKQFKAYIENEDAILFTSSKDGLSATSNEMLVIVNELLDYKIYYWLEGFNASTSGISNYHGKYFIEDISTSNETTQRLRRNTYATTINYFLSSLIDGTHRSHYSINAASLNENGILQNLGKVNMDGLLSYDAEHSIYKLEIPAFLEIEHLNLSKSQFNNAMSGGSGIGHTVDREIVENSINKNRGGTIHPTSLLFSNTSELLFDQYGNILNSQYIQRYGYWATQGMANVLPPQLNNTAEEKTSPTIDMKRIFIDLVDTRSNQFDANLKIIKNNWSTAFISALAELMIVLDDEAQKNQIHKLLVKKTGKNPGTHGMDWIQVSWNSDSQLPPWYADYKAQLYSKYDRRFIEYFNERSGQSSIRLDEILWGGVQQDGIPPLRFPELISLEDADKLNDNDVVFGIVHNGIARAYPQRILGWHEMVVDQFGTDTITGVYCTLCGTMIAYQNRIRNTTHLLGTSGFLYRSNKLMFDRETQSLWSTIEGKPVLGPLADRSLELQMTPVITTTWKEWREAYPDSKVLSFQTGHNRNYEEGAAYKAYYSHDNLMFPVPTEDNRLNNKDLVFTIRNFDDTNPIAFDKKYLIKKELLHYSIDETPIIILTSSSGKTMAYESKNFTFTSKSNKELTDQFGSVWTKTEKYLINKEKDMKLSRLNGHEIFWFAWVNVFPSTELIK